MKTEKNMKIISMPASSAKHNQIQLVVDGCKVKLNFPEKSEDKLLNDIKRMLLNVATKV